MSGRPGPSSSTAPRARAAPVASRRRTPPPVSQRRVDRVAHQVDQQLIELVAVARHRRPPARRSTLDRQAGLERGHAPHPGAPRRPAPSCGGGSRASRAYAAMKRPSASARAPITSRPRAMSSLPVGRARRPRGERCAGSGDRLDRRERVVDLVAEHADQPLPGLALLGAQRALRSVSTSSWCGRPPWRKCCAAPPSGPAPPGKVRVERARRLAVEAARRARAPRRRPSSRSAGCAEQPLAARDSPAEPPLAVEGEDGDVDLLDHPRGAARWPPARRAAARAASRRSALTSSSARPSASSGRGAARADREVALAQRGEQVGERLQRARPPARAAASARPARRRPRASVRVQPDPQRSSAPVQSSQQATSARPGSPASSARERGPAASWPRGPALTPTRPQRP